jgi:hypothetical protein
MTLGIAWVRVVGSVRELIVASDSRLSGGQWWDANQKILLLPRSDCVLSFSGHTHDAYPLMQQAYSAIAMHEPAKNRSMDIADLKGHLIRVFNHCREFISYLPTGQTEPDVPDALFMLSGFSWKTQRFHIWKLYYDASIKKFTFRPTSPWAGQATGAYKMVAYVGDKDAVASAKHNLTDLLRQRNMLNTSSLNMEPFEVLRDIIRSGSHSSVGGPIQLCKIYEHSNVAPVGVYWPNKAAGTISLFGRPLMAYEKSPWGVIDPDDPGRANAVE